MLSLLSSGRSSVCLTGSGLSEPMACLPVRHEEWEKPGDFYLLITNPSLLAPFSPLPTNLTRKGFDFSLLDPSIIKMPITRWRRSTKWPMAPGRAGDKSPSKVPIEIVQSQTKIFTLEVKRQLQAAEAPDSDVFEILVNLGQTVTYPVQTSG